MKGKIKVDYDTLEEGGFGGCLSCGDVNQGEGDWCEPDAREYTCVECGMPTLYGLEELMMMGRLDIEGLD